MAFLVPRELRRSGMTGSVPYYGGRLTPAHIAGIKESARTPLPAPPAPPPGRVAASPAQLLGALALLRDAGVISPAEFDGLRARRGL